MAQRNPGARWPKWMYLFGAVSSQHNTESLRSPDAIPPRRDLGLVQSSCDLMQLEPLCAHSLDLAQHFLLMRQRDQQTPPLVVNVLAELVPVRRGAKPDPLSHHVPQRVPRAL